MGKAEQNKLHKQTSLLNAAFNLFTTKGVNKTTIADISELSGLAKGTFYLYFKDKYDIRNKLIAHKSSVLFQDALNLLQESPEYDTFSFEDKIIFIIDKIIDELNANKSLLTFISKNLSWGIFRDAIENQSATEDMDFKEFFFEKVVRQHSNIKDPELMIFLIIELVSSTSYSCILYSEPTSIEKLKPSLYEAVRAIIKNHTID